MDPYEQQLQKASLLVEETDGSVEHVKQTSLLDLLSFFLVQLEGVTISISTGILEQVSRLAYIFKIAPLSLFLPKRRNIIQQHWINLFLGAALTG